MTVKQKIFKFVKKYFCEGQKLEKSQEVALQTLPPDAPFTQKLMVQHRQLIGVLIPFTFYNVIWCVEAHANFRSFLDKWPIPASFSFIFVPFKYITDCRLYPDSNMDRRSIRPRTLTT